MNRIYICIDLKSFYASVECRERGLDPLDTNLVVADSSRTDKTICLAVTPTLKKYGLSGRSRLYEVVGKVKDINRDRKNKIFGKFKGKSYINSELEIDKYLELDYIVAPPRMKHYMDYSAKIYGIYLKYIAPEDIYAYSIDEVFCDITSYLKTYKMTPHELITKMIKDVYDNTGITATGGIGTNMYLAKVAMDIVAKHMEANAFGVRIAELDEISYRKLLWTHRPITDFWRVGKGIANKLLKYKIYTMGDICRCSIENEELLYKLFGINAELLIDHAWGWEPTTLSDVKKYKPKTNSLSSGQVLAHPYKSEKARLIVKEMVDSLVLDLVKRNLVTNQIVLTICYDVSNLSTYTGDVKNDFYGRLVPKDSHGTINIDHRTSSTTIIMKYVLKLFDSIIRDDLTVRRIYVVFCNTTRRNDIKKEIKIEQFNLFDDYEQQEENNKINYEEEEKENNLQRALLDIKKKYGKNSILRGMNYEEGGTMIERNGQVGGHKG